MGTLSPDLGFSQIWTKMGTQTPLYMFSFQNFPWRIPWRIISKFVIFWWMVRNRKLEQNEQTILSVFRVLLGSIWFWNTQFSSRKIEINLQNWNVENQFRKVFGHSFLQRRLEKWTMCENGDARTQMVDFRSGLQLFRGKRGIRKNGDVFQNSLLFLSKMGSHFVKNVLYFRETVSKTREILGLVCWHGN